MPDKSLNPGEIIATVPVNIPKLETTAEVELICDRCGASLYVKASGINNGDRTWISVTPCVICTPKA